MSGISAALLKGVFLGLGAAVPLGPVNVQIVRRTLHRGFLAGFSLGCGAVSVDVFYALLSTFSLGRFASDRRVLIPLTLGGVALLTYLGVQSIRGGLALARKSPASGPLPEGESRPAVFSETAVASYATGLLMTLLNPMTLGFWFIAVPAIAGDLSAGSGISRNLAPSQVPPPAEAGQLPIICIGVFCGTLAWVVFFAGLLTLARRRRRGWWFVLADLVGGGVLLCLAGATLWRSIPAFL